MKDLKGFWSCNKPFKVRVICLSHTRALQLAQDNYRLSEKNLLFQAAQNVPSAQVLFSHIWRARR